MQTLSRPAGLVLLMVTLSAGAWARAQVTPYWITDGDYHRIFKVQNGAVQQAITELMSDHSYPLAVANTIRTLNYVLGDRQGREYLLNGTPTSTTYTLPSGGPTFTTDGTTDGSDYNYSISWNDGGVWRFNRHWENPQFLFAAGENFGGITYDTTSGTLWVNSNSGGETSSTLRNYSVNGALLASITINGVNGWGLAYEQATDTLWMLGPSVLDSSNKQVIKNYSKTGTLLASIEIPTMIGGNALGGEMQIPEPVALSALALTGLLFRRARAR